MADAGGVQLPPSVHLTRASVSEAAAGLRAKEPYYGTTHENSSTVQRQRRLGGHEEQFRQHTSMRTRTGDAAPLLEVEEDGRSEDGQCKHHRPSISTSSWTRTAGLAVGAVLLILALRAAHEEARRCVRP